METNDAQTPSQKETQVEKLKTLSQNSSLSEAVKNSELLLNYVTEQGMKIDDEVTHKIVKAKYLEQNKAWTEAEEATFWNTFRQITKAVKPVSIESILAATEQKSLPIFWFTQIFGIKTRTTLAKRAVRRHTIGAFVSLILLLVCQVYFVTLSTLLIEVNISEENIKDVKNKMSQFAKVEDDKSAQVEIAQLSLRLEDLAEERRVNLEMLGQWQRPFSFYLFGINTTLSSSEKEKMTIKERLESDNKIGLKQKQVAQQLISILQLYILPLLYGLLGAYAFILRVLSKEIKLLTYSQESEINYRLRISLGILAGLAVGLLLAPNDTKSLISLNLPPLTLAFIAGYAIEVLFTAIDQFIGGVTKNRREAQGAGE